MMGFLLGGMSLRFGVVFILLPRATTITFDRRAGTAELTSIAKVEVEGHTDSDGDRMFKISMEIAGEEPMRFTTYSSSGKVDKQDVADAVRDYLARKNA